MKFHSADHAVEAYILDRQGVSTLKAQRYGMTDGVARAKQCKCETDKTSLSLDKRRNVYVLRCYRCAALVGEEAAETPRGRVTGAIAASTMQDRAAERATLRVAVESLRTWERRVIVAYVERLAPGPRRDGESLEDVARRCMEAWPRRGEAWTVYRVRSDLRDARQRLERELRRRGMLAA